MTQAGCFFILQMLNTGGAAAVIPAVSILNSRHFAMSFKVNYESEA